MKIRILIVLLCCYITSQAQDTLRYQQKNDLPYRTGNQTAYMKERCKLDIYYPQNARNVPVIVWFHGGGITGGSKSIPKELKQQNMIIIAANYRLHPQAKCPEYIDDAAAAVAWAFNHAREYGGDTARIYVSGHSAGGYLAEMIGLDKSYLKPYKIDADRIAALFPFSGQAITHFTVRKEQNIAELQPTIDRYAPLFHVRADAPPLYLYTGDRELELLGRYEENAYLARMMKLAGHKNTFLYELDGYGHGDMPIGAFHLMLQAIKGKK
ncbi:alpha/beta hydrolase [Chitinophaga sedimenti]|uniref:alpha/beta hydrolase n=1 Tax=Chitinophaga sedimenti TaxID=2033606 RepID=UPI002003D735|nr:alpha/beta hydrolase [Chitinophaga sedimenti]MCK7555909.1 alpha/beta hydrolase [Chitinophaga sedimenti]